MKSPLKRIPRLDVKLPAPLQAGLRWLYAFVLGRLRAVFGPRPRKFPVMKPFVDLGALWRKFALVLTPIGLFVFCLLYGFFFALTAPYLIVPFAAPIVLLMLMAVWALPERTSAPTKTMELFFSAVVICLILWPNYLALALPGLPWITAIRITGMPMALLFLVSLSTSAAFRREIKEIATTVPTLWVWFVVFIGIQVVTLALSKSPPSAMQKTIIQQVNWTTMALVAAWVCRTPGRVDRYLMIVVLTAAPMMTLGLLESFERHLLWAGYVPSFLKIDDPIAASIFSSIVRSATGQYRSKVTFSTPLGLAEYFALLTPFVIHFVIGRYPRILKVFCFLLAPALFYGVRLTDARLGVIGFLVSTMLYVLIWGMLRFRRNRRDLLAATIVYAYPALFCAAAIAVTTISSVNVLVFGNGAQAASNAARAHQLTMGIPKVLMNPIGHGSGGAGQAMGYGANDFIAIDNYYLVIGLDYGVLGLVSFLGIFLLVIGWSVRSVLTAADNRDREIALLTPLAVALSAFLVIKLVFAQADMHPLVFAYLGMAVALIQRVREGARHRLTVLQTAPPPTQRSRFGRVRRPVWDDDDAAGVEDDEPVRLPPRRPGVAV